MHSLKQDLLFLIAVRDCYDLKLLLNINKFRRKFISTLTVHKIDENGEHWYIPGKKIGTDYHSKVPDKNWQISGKYHRENGPAFIDSTVQVWRVNGYLHNDKGPAIICTDGEQEWYINGEIHRVDGPAATRPDGSQEWWINGKRHNEKGPAVICANGEKHW